MTDHIPLVYIAGPYTAPEGHDYRGYHGIERNIGNARQVAAWLVDLGVYFFCPHLNSAHFEVIRPNAQPQYWYELDLRILRHCDAVLLIHGWRNSKGAVKECEVAIELGIPVFELAEEGAPMTAFFDFIHNFGGQE